MKIARLVPVVALAALVGCTPPPTTAADVAGTTISQAELTQSVEGCRELGFQVTENDILMRLVLAEAVKTTANENGFPMDSEILNQAAVMSPDVAPMLGNEGCARAAEVSVALSLLASVMPTEEIVEEVTNVDVEVNPRYGQWDPVSATIGGSGSLSVPGTVTIN